MSAETVKVRVQQLEDRQDIQRWIRRFRKLCEDMPKEIWVYSDGPVVLVKDQNNKIYMRGDGVDPDAVIANGFKGHWDGGGW